MRDENDLVKWTLILLGVLAAMWAFWRVWVYENNAFANLSARANLAAEKPRTRVSQPKTSAKSLETLKTQELLEPFILAEKSTPSVSTRQPVSQQQKNAKTKIPAVTLKQNSTAVPRYTSGNLPPRSLGVHDFAMPSAGNITSSQPSVYTPTQEEALQQERAHMLAPYLIPNKQAQKKLDRELADLSTGITRALQRALAPKSKKEANIEKYLNRSNPSRAAASSDPLQEVVAQVGAQKANLVRQTQEAFGKAAANKVGSLMDSFQQAVAKTVEDPLKTEQEKAEEVQKIAHQYQQQLSKLNQENQYNQFVQNRIDADNEKIAALQQAYADNEALKDQFTQIITQARENDLQLAQRRDLTPQEHAAQFYANQYKVQEDLKKAVQKAGASPAPLNKVLTKLAQEDLAVQLQKEEEGKVSSVGSQMSPTQLNGLLQSIDHEREQMLSNIETQYGKETAARFEPVMMEYRTQMENLGKEELSEAQRNEKQLKTVNEFNQKIVRVQMDLVKESPAPQEIKEAQLKQLQKTLDDLAAQSL